MKKLLIMTLIFALSLPLFADKVEEMLDSSDLMQQKLGISQAARKPALEKKVIELFKNKETNLEARMVAARTLGVYKTDLSLDTLLEVIKEDSEDLQSSIVNALIKFGNNEKSVNAIINLLKSGKTEFIRSIAAQSLSNLSNEKVVDALIESLDDDSILVRKKAANSLGEIGNKKSVPALQKLYKDEDDADLKSYIFSALKKMGAIESKSKSTTTALLFGITPVNGLALWYADKKVLAITDFVVEAAAVGMMVYGYDGFNQMNENQQYVNAGKHWSFIGGVTLFTVGYIIDIVLPIMTVSKYNQDQESKNVYNFTPSFFTDGKTTVAGFSFNF